MRQDVQAPLTFPVGGIDVTCEYGRQPQDTTPAAANVVAFEPLTDRGRGGSRPGTNRLFPNPLISLTSPVQHLAVLVDPQAPALRMEAGLELSGYILDPSTSENRLRVDPGSYVPAVGSGKKPKKRRQDDLPDIELVQTARNQTTPSGATFQTVFNEPPEAGNLILVMVRTQWVSPLSAGRFVANSTVENDALTPVQYTQVGGSGFSAKHDDLLIVPPDPLRTDKFTYGWYWAIADGTEDYTTVRVVTPYSSSSGSGRIYEVFAMEYRGASSVGNYAINNQYKVDIVFRSGTIRPPQGADSLMICVMNRVLTYSVPEPFVRRSGVPSSDLPPTNFVTFEGLIPIATPSYELVVQTVRPDGFPDSFPIPSFSSVAYSVMLKK